MSEYNYSEVEKQINTVLAHQEKELSEIHRPSIAGVNDRISESETLLQNLGYGSQLSELRSATRNVPIEVSRKVMVVPSWENLCLEAEKSVGTGCELEDIFTPEELANNEVAIRELNEEYNVLHRLDKYDIAISVAAGLLGAAVDILLVGIPQKTPEGLKGGTLANYVRDWFDKKFPDIVVIALIREESIINIGQNQIIGFQSQPFGKIVNPDLPGALDRRKITMNFTPALTINDVKLAHKSLIFFRKLDLFHGVSDKFKMNAVAVYNGHFCHSGRFLRLLENAQGDPTFSKLFL